MSDSLDVLQHRIGSADELKSVVRTMKVIAASNITRYAQAVRAMDVYDETIRRGLAVVLRHDVLDAQVETGRVGVVVVGSDQGLVGQFNDEVSAVAHQLVASVPQYKVWAVGERVADRLSDSGIPLAAQFDVPTTTHATTGLVAQLLSQIAPWLLAYPHAPLWVIHHKQRVGEAHAPIRLRLLPLDDVWQKTLVETPWPSRRLPEVMGDRLLTLRALVREYLFVSLYRASTESMACENASRLAAMQRADKNIDELLGEFKRDYYLARQENIDEELFDVIAGFETQSSEDMGKKSA
uniref:Putative ATP synthase gamma chain (ATP synthase F1 sector gamma subunit) AtpG n=1 Tax=mine drainage metagenome TaxID=410659 RepID=E6QTJ5_9ZZZZ